MCFYTKSSDLVFWNLFCQWWIIEGFPSASIWMLDWCWHIAACPVMLVTFLCWLLCFRCIIQRVWCSIWSHWWLIGRGTNRSPVISGWYKSYCVKCLGLSCNSSPNMQWSPPNPPRGHVWLGLIFCTRHLLLIISAMLSDVKLNKYASYPDWHNPHMPIVVTASGGQFVTLPVSLLHLANDCPMHY